MEDVKFFINTFIQIFALLSPFGVSVFFAANTLSFEPNEKKQAAKIAIISITTATLLMFLLGNFCLKVFGITLDAFRIGTGIIMLLNAISIVRGTKFYSIKSSSPVDFAIVPFAIPYVVGPGIIGYLIVLSVETVNYYEKLEIILALLIVIGILAILLFNIDKMAKILGRRNMSVMDRLLGLLLCSMAAQIIMVGIQNFLK